VSPTKQAKGDSGKEPKLHQVTSGGRQVANRCLNGEKKPWEKPGLVRGPVLLWPTVLCYDSGSYHKSDRIATFKVFIPVPSN